MCISQISHAVVLQRITVAYAVGGDLVIESVVDLHSAICRLIDRIPNDGAVVPPDQQDTVVKTIINAVSYNFKINAPVAPRVGSGC